MLLLEQIMSQSILTDAGFWAVVVPLFVAIIGSYFRYVTKISILCVEIDNQESKFDARINSLKEQMSSDKKSVVGNHDKLYLLCESMNERLSRIEGALNGKK